MHVPNFTCFTFLRSCSLGGSMGWMTPNGATMCLGAGGARRASAQATKRAMVKNWKRMMAVGGRLRYERYGFCDNGIDLESSAWDVSIAVGTCQKRSGLNLMKNSFFLIGTLYYWWLSNELIFVFVRMLIARVFYSISHNACHTIL